MSGVSSSRATCLKVPTVWLAEGLLMYLSAADAADLMKQVRLHMTNLAPSSHVRRIVCK